MVKKNEPPVVVEEIFDAPVEVVWRAITDLAEMKKWFFENIPDFQPEIGFKTSFNVSSGERDFPHLWEILEVLPESKIVYNWKYANFVGDSNVIFELFGEGEKTRLRLTTVVLQDFPDEIPEFRRESCEGGWNYFIKDRLKDFLESLN